MRGKAGLVIGLGVGYVLGTRAGRARYEQIKAAANKVWQLEPVQKQVKKAQGFAASSVMALPSALWNAGVKVVGAARRGTTPGEKLDAAVAQANRSSAEVKKAADESLEAVREAAKD